MAVFAGEVLVARDRPAWFAFAHELERHVIRLTGPARDVAADPDVLELGFWHYEMGTVLLKVAIAFEVGDAHPLELAIYAGPWAFPHWLWSEAARALARRFDEWMERLLLALSGPTEARYGAIGQEEVFPTPAALAAGTDSEMWPSTWFWPPFSSPRDRDRARLVTRCMISVCLAPPAARLVIAWEPHGGSGDRVGRYWAAKDVAAPA